MSDFKSKRRKLAFANIPADDAGITVADALILLNGSQYRDQILAALDVESITDETIAIPGAATLVKSVLELDSKIEKFDLPRHYHELVFVRPGVDDDYHETDIAIQFTTGDASYGTIIASPAYASQGDLLEKTAFMRSHGRKLIKHERIDIIYRNLEEVRSIYNAEGEPHLSSYRILKDLNNNKYYYRALTSTSHYRDYNVKLSVFVFLVAIHRLMKETGDEYFLNRAEHTDSRIRAFFEKNGRQHISPLGRVKFLLELRNNEIKEGSVKFSGVCALVYEDDVHGVAAPTQPSQVEFEAFEDEYAVDDAADNTPTQDIYLTPRPNRLKYNIEAIKHNINPSNALPRMLVADRVRAVEQLIYKDLEIATDAKTLEQIRALVESKIKALPNDSFLGVYKKQLRGVVPDVVKDVETLLRMVGNLNLIVPSENANAKDTLRQMFFEAIVERGRRNVGQTDNEEAAE